MKLVDTAQVKKATDLVGELQADDLSKAALKGLAIANTKASKEAIQPVLGHSIAAVARGNERGKVSMQQFELGTGKTAPLSKDEVGRLRTLSTRIGKVGIEPIIKSGELVK